MNRHNLLIGLVLVSHKNSILGRPVFFQVGFHSLIILQYIITLVFYVDSYNNLFTMLMSGTNSTITYNPGVTDVKPSMANYMLVLQRPVAQTLGSV